MCTSTPRTVRVRGRARPAGLLSPTAPAGACSRPTLPAPHPRPGAGAFLMGLCEGNHCKGGSEGRDKGSGRIILAQLEWLPSGDCV